jgi:predicted HAD superfamily phosphohydrolase
MTSLTFMLTIAFIVLTVALLIYFLIKPTYRSVINGPSILTSIGIFGTFLGIAIGLLFFDTNQVHQAVPDFLAGIKLAFWSSVAGIGCALIHKFKYLLYPYDLDGEADERDILKKMIGALHGLRNSFEKQELLITKQLENSKLLALQNRESFGEDIERLADVLKRNNNDAMDKADSQFSKTAQMLDDVSDKLGGILGNVGGFSSANEEQFNKVVGKLGDVSDHFEATLAKLGDNLGGKMDSGLKSVGGTIGDKIEATSEKDRAAYEAQMALLAEKLAAQAEADAAKNREAYSETVQGLAGSVARLGGDVLDAQGSRDDAVAAKLDDLGDRIESAMQVLAQAMAEDAASQRAGMIGGMDDLIEQLAQDNRETATAVRELVGKVADEREAENSTLFSKLDDVVGKLVENNEASGLMTRELLDKIAGEREAENSTLFSKLDDVVGKLVENNETSAAMTRELLDKIAGEREAENSTLFSKLDDVVGKLVENNDASAAMTRELLDKIAGKREAENSTLFSKLDDVVGKLVENNDASAAMTRELLDKVVGQNAAATTAMSDKMSEALKNLAEQNSEDNGAQLAQMMGRLDDLGDRLESAMQVLAQTVAEGSSGNMGGLDSLMERMAEDSQKSSDMIGKLVARLEDNAEKDREDSRKGMDKLAEELRNALGNSNSRLSDALSGLADINEASLAKLEALVDKQGKTTDAYRKASMKLAKDQVESLANAMREDASARAAQSGAESDAREANLIAAIESLQKYLEMNAKAREKMDQDLVAKAAQGTENLSVLIKGLREDAEKDRDAILQLTKDQANKLDANLGELLKANKGILDAELKALEQQMADKADRDSRLAELIKGSQEASTKAMLRMLKEILDATQKHNREIAVELGKLRQDVSAEYKATADMTEALMKQLRSMSEAYKSAVLASAAELKAQMAHDMKENHQLIEKYQLAALDRLEGVAGIMENVVASSSDMGALLHENSMAMKTMQNAFVGTNEGSFGRFMLDMNERVLSQLKGLEDSFTAQGNMGKLMQDMNEETTKQLRIMERSFDAAADQIKQIPQEIAKHMEKK